MEQPKHHEIVRPLVEIAQQVGGWVLDKIVPPEAVELVQQEAVERTVTAFQLPLSYDSEGNWHNPDGEN